MTFAAPGFLWLGAGLISATVALHLLARRAPRERPLPTARFVPERTVSAPAPRFPPSDLLLLVLRTAVVTLIALAFARPEVNARSGVRRLLLMDHSASVASVDEAADSVVRLARPGDVILAFDTAMTEVHDPQAVEASPARGSLTTALLGAVRAARAAAVGRDSLELIVVSPFAREEWDSATSVVRTAWAGRARVVPIRAASLPLDGVEAAIPPDDPLAATLTLGGMRRPSAMVRLVREPPEPSDSTWAHETGGALVVWPASPGSLADTVGGVIAGDAVVVAALERPATTSSDLPGLERQAVADTDAPEAGREHTKRNRPIAWWIDGAVAATERPVGRGCIREIAIPVTSASDLALRPSFVALARELTAPCGGRRATEPVGDSIVDAFAGAGPLLAGRQVAAPLQPRIPANPWLLVGALALLLLEPVARRRRAA